MLFFILLNCVKTAEEIFLHVEVLFLDHIGDVNFDILFFSISKANSVVFSDVIAPTWLHRFIIGKGGSNIKEITSSFPAVS